MNEQAAAKHNTSVPFYWRGSTAHAFLEIPVEHPLYRSIELQYLVRDDRVGHIVELHLHSGALEIYAEPNLELDIEWFQSDPPFAHFELEALTDTDFDQVRCDIATGSVEADASFVDLRGDRIDIRVRLADAKAVQPLFTPAPVQATPANLRFLLMNEFRLLPTRKTDIEITVNGAPVAPEPFLVPKAGLAPYLEARAGTNFLLVGLNPNHKHRPLPRVPDGVSSLDEQTEVTVDGGQLQSMTVRNEHGWLSSTLTPAMPSPEQVVATGDSASGRFEVGSPIGSVCTGRWAIWPVGEGVAFELTDLSQDWSPGYNQPTRMGLRTLRSYRRRNQRWSYRAGLELVDDVWHSSGSWSTT